MLRLIFRDKSFRLAITITLIFFGTGIIFLMLGLTNYNWVLFVLLPIVVGVSIGALPSMKYAVYGTLIAVVLFLLVMYVPGLSGFICIIMALPIIIPLIFLGYTITFLIRRYRQIKSEERLSVLLLPLIVFIVAAPLNDFLTANNESVIEVRTTQLFDYSPEQVYDAIKSVDTLWVDKTFLMNFDLPVPVRCVLEKEEVGGLRTCYFKSGNLSNSDFGSGTITERITELERGRILRMDVIDYNILGRDWLGFKEAIYYFEPAGPNRCKMTRVTTYTSKLTPRIYWEPWEKLGIREEHEFVFRNLSGDLEKKYHKGSIEN